MLENLKESGEQSSSTSETSGPSTSRLDAVEQQLRKLTKAVADLTGYVKVMDEQQEKRLERLSTSNHSDASSKNFDSLHKKLHDLTQTLLRVGEILTRSEVVRLDDGSSVTRSELSAHAMVTKVLSEMEGVSSAVERLAEEVRAKREVRVDSGKVAQVVTSKLGATIDQKLAESADRVESVLAAHEARLAELGDAKIAGVTKQLDEATKGLERAEKVASGLRGALTWAGVGKVAAASIPLALVALAMAMLLGLGGQLLGVEPLFAWAWASFAAAETWWAKLLIAVATLGGASALGWVIYKFGQKLYETYRGW